MPWWRSIVRWFSPPRLGRRGERLAARYLRRKGYKIVAAGRRSRAGELDLVAVDGRCVVFVEVKTRRTIRAGHPVEAVHEEKQRRLSRAARAFLKQHRLLEQAARFDVIAILWPKGEEPTVQHFENAFPVAEPGRSFF